MQNRREQELDFAVTQDDVKSAVCADPNQCTFACAIAPLVQDQYGITAAETLRVTMAFGDDLEEDDKVLVAWDGDDGRHYAGEISGNTARHIVMLTDIDKTSLLKKMRKDHKEGIPFKLEKVESRNKQPASKEGDSTTLRWARNHGYAHGRTATPETRRAVYEDSSEFQGFTEQQKTEYDEGFKLGMLAGPNKGTGKRKPRRSGKNGRVFGAQV